MTSLHFNKYQGAGNDFIIIDNRNQIFNPHDNILIEKLCNRRFGIGADGLILINNLPDYDFEMVYFNSDGYRGSMCGNGGRCAAAFAIKTGIASGKMKFMAYDGIHEAYQTGDLINLKMNDVRGTENVDGKLFINTGSPHCIIFRKNVDETDVFTEGRTLRYSEAFKLGGTNVNFVETGKEGIYVRTYERGVEDETLSCGTGVTASAIASVTAGHFDSGPVDVRTRGGNLTVDFKIGNDMITDIWLKGPALFVFEGIIEI